MDREAIFETAVLTGMVLLVVAAFAWHPVAIAGAVVFLAWGFRRGVTGS